jgi:hypothetical protein
VCQFHPLWLEDSTMGPAPPEVCSGLSLSSQAGEVSFPALPPQKGSQFSRKCGQRKLLFLQRSPVPWSWFPGHPFSPGLDSETSIMCPLISLPVGLARPLGSCTARDCVARGGVGGSHGSSAILTVWSLVR